LPRSLETDVEGLIGAGRFERRAERATWRNGHRERSLDTRLGTLNLKTRSCGPAATFLASWSPGARSRRRWSRCSRVEPRSGSTGLPASRRGAWMSSSRRLGDLPIAVPGGHGSTALLSMGMSGISKSSVSKLCKDIDERVNAFLKRPLSGEWPYLWLDATYLNVREGGRIVSVAVIVAVAVTIEGRREIVGLHIGPSEAEVFWTLNDAVVQLARPGQARTLGREAGDLRRP
jgi:putative transposase